MPFFMLRGLRHNRFWKDRRGSDLIEYALMAGLVALTAGAIVPGLAASISSIFGQASARSAMHFKDGRGKATRPNHGSY
jgi:Flp pilus assembly pilin Flp